MTVLPMLALADHGAPVSLLLGQAHGNLLPPQQEGCRSADGGWGFALGLPCCRLSSAAE